MAKKEKQETVSLETRVQALEERMEMLESSLETAEPVTGSRPSRWAQMKAWTKEKVHSIAVKAMEVTA